MKTIFLISGLFLFHSILYSQAFNGTENQNDTIRIGDTIKIPITDLDTVKINGNPYNVSCGLIQASSLDSFVILEICGVKDTIDFSLGILRIIPPNSNNAITINKGAQVTRQINPIVVKDNSTFERNIYADAYILCFGEEGQQKDILSIWNPNPNNNYLKNIFSLQSTEENRAKTKPSGILGFNVTTIADGFAKFLVSRVKKELAIAFFRKLKDKINDDNVRDFRVLFHSTHAIFNEIEDRIYRYETYLPAIKQSFEYDLEFLPVSLSTLIKDDDSQLGKFLSDSIPESRFYISSFLDFGNALRSNEHIGNIISELPKNPTTGSANKNFLGLIETLALFSESLRNPGTEQAERYWINLENFNLLASNDKFFNCFMGLIVEKARQQGISFESSKSLADFLNDMHTDVANLRTVYRKINNITLQIDRLKLGGEVNTQNKINYLRYFDLANEFVGMVKPVNALVGKVIEEDKVSYILQLNNSIQGLASHISSRQYSLALLDFISLMEQIDQNGHLGFFTGFLSNQGMFIAQIGEAESSDQVAEIIENYAAPVGSWRDKREAQWNITFDSYVGAGGYLITSADDHTSKVSIPTPIGFSVTTPWNWFTFMGSVVDIGPMVAFRFLDDENNIPNTYLKEIIAPGVFMSMNLDEISNRDLLLKFNVGYQQFPLLEKTTSTINNISLTQKSGWVASINVNIPIMTLYHKKAE